MPNNYVLLDRIELNATAASVTFDNIPQTGYTDLKIVWSARQNTGAAVATYLSFNGLTTNFTGRYLYTDATTVSSGTLGRYIGSCLGTNFTANVFNSSEIYIPNYTSANNKSFSAENVDENNATATDMNLIAGLWSSTAAITSITISPASGSFVSGSTFSLYGVAKLGTTPAIAPKASGGNVIGTDGTYWYHAFLSNGTFTPQTNLNADVLVVAGGGGGGPQVGGGGGAGGVIYFAGQSLTATNYACTVGSGGAGGVIQVSNGSNGTNSTFAALTAAFGGGGGGRYNANNGLAGGSGGGGSGQTSTGGSSTQTGTGATAFYGNAGGSNPTNQNVTAAGGGGAGAVGGNTVNNSNLGGAGGIGTNVYSSWATATSTGVSGYYAGGGGGAIDSGTAMAGGTGGGGAGGVGTSVSPTAGTANTGGGGGGNRDASSPTGNSNGAAGGSGIVIVRYLVA